MTAADQIRCTLCYDLTDVEPFIDTPLWRKGDLHFCPRCCDKLANYIQRVRKKAYKLGQVRLQPVLHDHN